MGFEKLGALVDGLPLPCNELSTLDACGFGGPSSRTRCAALCISSADGTAFWKRLSLYYPQRTTSSWSVGENLLWTSGDLDSVRALGIWMTSAEHRATILDPRWRDVGIAAVEAAGAPGMYSGLNVVVVTADFGTH